MKTKNRSYFLSAILIGIVMMLTACAVERDNAAWNNPLGSDIYGLWYADYPEMHSGTDPIVHSKSFWQRRKRQEPGSWSRWAEM